jgi:fructosamine-3-kinase
MIVNKFEHVEQQLKKRFGNACCIQDVVITSGGDTCNSAFVKTSEGSFFLKWPKNGGSQASRDMFTSEATSLKALHQGCSHTASGFWVPEVIGVGKNPGEEYLLLEKLPPKNVPSLPGWEEVYGRSLALLHQNTADAFGFSVDTFCGESVQINTKKQSWSDFYIECRINPLYEQLQQHQSPSERFCTKMESFMWILPTLLAGTEEPPALIHGDLWTGNFYETEHNANVKIALYDPALSYSHREAEFGMIFLFGRFSETSQRAYEEVCPLLAGWRERIPVYKLYHLMNHYRLFGEGYSSECENILDLYV